MTDAPHSPPVVDLHSRRRQSQAITRPPTDPADTDHADIDAEIELLRQTFHRRYDRDPVAARRQLSEIMEGYCDDDAYTGGDDDDE